MSNSYKSWLESLKQRASGAVVHGYVPTELEAKYEKGHDLFVELGDGELRDWVAERYREWYQEWQDGEREPPCRCANPACALKNGRLPYEIRHDGSPFEMTNTPPVDDRIKNYLDEHPEAVVLHDAMQELREKRQRCERLFEEVLREEAKIDPQEAEQPNP